MFLEWYVSWCPYQNLTTKKASKERDMISDHMKVVSERKKNSTNNKLTYSNFANKVLDQVGVFFVFFEVGKNWCMSSCSESTL